MNSQELEFILRMRDEATAALKRFGGGAEGAGRSARKFSDENKKAAKSLDEVVRKAKEAGKAIGGVFIAGKGVRAGLAAFNTYEQGMLNVQKTTNATQREMAAFEKQIDSISRRLTGIKVGNILDIAGIAGQLGVAKDHIGEFAETMAKLEIATDLSGAEGATDMARFLTLADEGTERIKEMSDVLVGLGNTVKAQESEILRMGRVLAQSTKQFQLGGAALLGIGAAAAELDFRPELFSTAMQRTLIQLSDAAQYGGEGMRQLSLATGMSQQEFQKLIKENPQEAFFKFLDVLKALNADGQSLTGFLSAFNLQGMETVKVLGTAAASVDQFRDRVALANEELANPGALDKEYENFAKGLEQQWTGLLTSVQLLMKDMVTSVAPVLKTLVATARAVVDGIAMVFGALPDTVKPWVVSLGVAAGALKGIGMVASLLLPNLAKTFATGRIGAFLASLSGVRVVLGMLLNPIKLVQLAFTFMVGVAQGALGALVAAFGAVPVAIGLAVAAIAGIGIALWKNWDSVKAFFSQSWSEIGSQIVGAITGAFTSAMARAKGIWEDFWAWATRQTIEQRAFDQNIGGGIESLKASAEKALSEAGTVEVDVTPKVDVSRLHNISDEQRKLIEGLDSITKARAEVKALEDAVNALAALPKSSAAYPGDEEIARLRAQVELRKRELDPVGERLRMLQIEIDEAGAITAERRNELEVLAEIRDLEEQMGDLTKERRAEVEAGVRKLQETRKAAAYEEMTRDLRDQLQAAQAITQAEKNRVAILQEINRFERDNEALKAGQRAEVEALLAAIQQAEAFSGLESSLDPQGAAIRKFTEDLKVLENALASGALSPERFNQMKAQLERSTLSARDPFAAEMKSLREQMDVMKIGGDYRDADRRSQETVNRLMEQGVNITKEQVAALQAANRELQDMEKAQNSGLQGWANSVGTLRDNLLDMTKDFASGLSDAIAGALEGKRGGFTALLRRMASQMISVGVNQIMKTTVQGMQGASGMGGGIGNWFKQALGIGGGGTAAAAQDTGKAVADAVSSMTAANMTVTAGTVMINGTPVGAPGSGLPGTLSEGHQTFGIGPTEKITRQALAPIETASTEAAKTIETSAWTLRGSIDDMAKTASTATRQFTDVSKVLPARADFPAVQRDGLGLPIKRPPLDVGKSLQLTEKDVLDLKKGLMTEWVSGEKQGQGIIDTMLNRQASGKWGTSMKDVLDARKQFSDVNGPVAWKHGRRSVDDLSTKDPRFGRADKFVDDYLAKRASGMQSSVGDHLNYANPYYSTKNNLGWINKLEGPRFGAGKNIHHHGTTSDLQRFRPGDYNLQLPGQQTAGLDMMSTGSIPQVQQVAQQWQQQMTTANQTLAQAMPQQFTPAFQNVGQQFEQVFSQSGSALQSLAPQFQQIGQQAQSIVPSLGGFGQSLSGLMGPLMQAPGATGQFGSAIMQLIQQMSSGMGGFGGMFGMLGGLFHEGGDVGAGHPKSGYRMVPARAWAGAVKHHKGLKGTEYPAILKRGEKVLTANDNRRNSAVIEGLTDRLEQMQKNNSKQANRRSGLTNVNQNINVYAQDANSFRRSEGQLMADSSVKLRRLGGRNS